jgi:ATP-dependent DNA helicase RecG
MLKEDVLRLVNQRETESIELKSSLSKLEEIVEAISGFSNTKGGKILIGVSNNGGILGVKIGKDTVERLTNKIAQNTDPKVQPRISTQEINEKKIIVIDVKESVDKLVLAFGRPYKRVGKSTVKMSKDEYERLILEKHKEKLRFDNQICEEASYDDIDEKKVEEFLEQRAIKLKVEIPRVSIKDVLLKTIKVVKLVDGELKPTNAGILFFGQVPQNFVPQSEVKVARFKGTIMTEFIDSTILKGTFYEILRDTELFFWKNTRLASKIVEFKRVEIPEYPFEAIREAVINAMAHRDYFRTGATVSILIFDDRIEVQSPGALLPYLNVKNLEGVHETRNNLICDIFHQTKDMEKYGTGIGKMKRWMKEHGLKRPIFSTNGGFFKVIFYGPGERILDLVPSIPKERQINLKEAGLNERQINALKLMINENEKITIKKYVNLFKVSDKTAKRDLRGLVESDFVIKKGVKKGAYFEAK